MRQTALKRSKDGYVRELGYTPDGKRAKFRLGYDKDEAKRRLEAIIDLWLECERRNPVKPTWDAERLLAARTIATGRPARIPRATHEHPSDYFEKVKKLAGSGIPVEPDDPDEYAFGNELVTNELSRLATALNPRRGDLPQPVGQTLHQALAAWQSYIENEYRDDEGITDNGKTKLRQATALIEYLPDCDLGDLDWQRVDELFAIFRRRPKSKRYGKPMARKSCTNYIGELSRFHRQEHDSSGHGSPHGRSSSGED